ncbi:universal stress protein [soil metagenome]
MFRRILVPLDGSTFAEHALPHAVKAAQIHDTDLVLLLVQVRQTPATTDLVLREAIDEWEVTQSAREADYLERLATRTAHDHGVRVTHHLPRGEVVPCIEEEVKRQNIDLVVMTTHGRAGLERAWLGSVADALLRHIDVPILLIRPTAEEPGDSAGRGSEEPGDSAGRGSFGHILVALDGSERAERAILPGRALADREGARITLLRVVTPPFVMTSPFLPHAVHITNEEMELRTQTATHYVEDVLAGLPAHGDDVHATVIVDYHPAPAILGYAAENDVDLIAISTHGRGPVRRLIMGSVTDKVVRASNVPVLIC